MLALVVELRPPSASTWPCRSCASTVAPPEGEGPEQGQECDRRVRVRLRMERRAAGTELVPREAAARVATRRLSAHNRAGHGKCLHASAFCRGRISGRSRSSSRPPLASSSICSVVCSMPKRSREQQLEPCGGRGRGRRPARDDDVGGERLEAGGDGPDVQVVDRPHVLDLAELARRARRRRCPRGADSISTSSGSLDQAPGRGEDQGGDQEAGERVRSLPAGRPG